MAKKYIDDIVLENARIMFRNFSGEADKFTREGDRSFCVVIEDPELAATLANDGWNVRVLKPRDLDDEPTHYLQVKVSFKGYPPKVYLVTNSRKEELDEETINILDNCDILSSDMVIRPYSYEVGGRSGISAYLKELWVTIEETPFAHKYDHL